MGTLRFNTDTASRAGRQGQHTRSRDNSTMNAAGGGEGTCGSPTLGGCGALTPLNAAVRLRRAHFPGLGERGIGSKTKALKKSSASVNQAAHQRVGWESPHSLWRLLNQKGSKRLVNASTWPKANGHRARPGRIIRASEFGALMIGANSKRFICLFSEFSHKNALFHLPPFYVQ